MIYWRYTVPLALDTSRLFPWVEVRVRRDLAPIATAFIHSVDLIAEDVVP